MTATRVVFDEIGVRVTRWNGLVEQVSWDDLDSVLIETNDSGPIGTDLLWILAGKVSGCLVPGGAEGEHELLVRLQELPGFNNQAVIDAMGSVENARFVCWKRPGS
jgi:hypothetical protein